MTEALYAAEVKHHVLALREALVRHDENLKAWQLLDQAVPYFLLDDPEIQQARRDQREMVLHVLEPEAYADYYASNPHERPFEEQYGIRPEDAHEHLHRIRFLREGLERLLPETVGLDAKAAREKLRIIDLSANDGFMAVNLGQLGYTVDCVDLHPGNCAIAERRKADGAPGIGDVICGDLHRVRPTLTKDAIYGAVVCFETIEHVADPDETLAVMREWCRPDGRMFVSTPHEAVERGNLPNWAHVERKGHVRVFRAKDFEALLERHGDIRRFEIGPDRVMVAEVAPR